MAITESRCQKCDETVIIEEVDDDTEHYYTEDGLDCGGALVVVAVWRQQ